MKRIIGSLLVIIGVGAAGVLGAQAFFSDTETSVGNILQAGAIDLQIDNTSYRTNSEGVLVASSETSWDLRDLTVERFFNFLDLKPGDVGEDTISIHVNDNDAWACAHVAITENSENGLTEPETDLNDTEPDGELAEELNFAFWEDDGDNVFETGETIFVQGPASNVLTNATLPLAQPAGGLFGSTPLTGAQTHYIGKYYCYGNFVTAPLQQDGVGTSNPVTRGSTGFTCNGAGVGNLSQSDRLVGDISFYAVQSRNNADFNCGSVQWPTPVGLKVGANLAAYDNPASCSTTVLAGGSINTAIGTADPGETICVDPGTYSEEVIVNEEVTIASTGGPGTTTVAGGFQIEADNVTVKGFTVTPGTIGLGPTMSSFFLMTGSDNVVIRDNEIDGTGFSDPAGTRGIINAEGGTFNDVLIENNHIHDFTSGIYMSTINGTGDGVYEFTIRYNDIDNNLAGIGQLNEALVTLNEFEHSGVTQEAIGAGTDYDGSVISFNNFLNGTKINDYGAPTLIKAENNYFAPSGGAVQAPVNVDFTPEAGSAYAHN